MRKNHFLVLIVVFLVGCCPHQYEPSPIPDPLEPFCVPEKIRVAIVLGSGGVRGMAHIGVLEVLEEAGVPVDLIVGCSAGSIVGALYADNPCVSAIKGAVWKVRSDTLFEMNLLECRYGLCQGKSLNRVLDRYLGADTFADLKIPLVVVTADLYTGELIPIGAGDLVNAVQASCSIPFVFVPCEVGGRICVDGGTINPVPVQVARDLGAEIIIAVDLCELLPKTFPTNLFGVAKRSAEIAFMWQNETCTRKADVVIRPKTSGVGCFNDKAKGLIYEAGKRAAREQLPLIQELLAQNPDENNCMKRVVHLPPYKAGIYENEDPI